MVLSSLEEHISRRANRKEKRLSWSPGHLQVADGGRVVDPDVGAVGRRQREAVPEPDHRGAGVGLHLAADVGRVPLPRVDRHRAEHLGSVCSDTRREKQSTAG